jgi:chemotaxis signal transduction protein
VRADFISGMASKDDRFLMMLDIDKVFSSDGIALVRHGETQPGSERN